MFEAGATAEGRPDFAMAYVRGESITAYCIKHKLTLRERIDLVLQELARRTSGEESPETL